MLTNRRKSEIEQIVSSLQRGLWEHPTGILPHTPSHFDVLEPFYGAKRLGFKFEYVPELGRFGNGKEQFEVAGYINQQSKVIAISTSLSFSLEEQRFTAAHELGHAVLHQDKLTAHRDRPVNGAKRLGSKAPHEQEADYFAACYLMPRKFVEQEFKKRFVCSIAEFEFSENAAWILSPNDIESIIRPEPNSKSRALALAGFRISPQSKSLAEQFNVSVPAMAIRLEELGLRAEWP